MVKELFKQTEKLYHFTSFDTALKILDSKCLKFGKLSHMNDIHENDKIEFVDANKKSIEPFPPDLLETVHDEIHKYRQISLTAESENEDKLGFNLHQMWGLYADKAEGVCLVFDKKELIKKLEEDVIFGRVSYDDTIESYYISFSENPHDVPCEIKEQAKDIFFHKRKEWEHEQEFRLLKRCPYFDREEYLRFDNALKFIILSSKFCDIDEVRYYNYVKTIKDFAKDIPVLIYGNSLLYYSLDTANKEEQIWNSEEGYDILWYKDRKLNL